MIKYCTRCLYPDTKPDLGFDENGVCGACTAYGDRENVDWELREREFLEVVEQYRSKDGLNYDCVVPVSGGKDSTYQVLKLLNYDLSPLCVTATTCSVTEIGRRNIENLKHLGVDYIEVTTNPLVRKKINRFALTEIGDISWPEHVTIFTTPVRVAAQHGVRLLVWGENSQNEYGGPAASQDSKILDRRWLEEFGGMLGLRVNDLIGQEGLTKRDLIPYTYPSNEALAQVGVTGIFLGYFFPWDGQSNTMISQANGLETYPKTVEGHFLNSENLDNYQAGLHEYFMFLKFGYGRATAQASIHIRRNRISRTDAMRTIKQLEGKYPWTYLGRPLEEILGEINMSLEEFDKICDRFTNKQLFLTDNAGDLIRDEHGNLKKINYDNE